MTPLACFGRSIARFLSSIARFFRRHRFFRQHRPARSLRRDLWEMEGALESDAPKLASMFEMFNRLTRHERPTGIEPLVSPSPLLTAPAPPLMARNPRGPARPRGASRLMAITMLLALAFVVATCVAVSAQFRPVMRSCETATAAGLTGYRLSPIPSCNAYPAAKK
jgi:hypothetical protein